MKIGLYPSIQLGKQAKSGSLPGTRHRGHGLWVQGSWGIKECSSQSQGVTPQLLFYYFWLILICLVYFIWKCWFMWILVCCYLIYILLY